MRGRSARRSAAYPVGAHGRTAASAGVGGRGAAYSADESSVSSRSSGGRSRRRPLWPYVAVVLLLAAAIGGVAFYLWYQSFFSDTITSGIFINGKHVGGRNPEELRSALNKEYDEKIRAMSVTITGEGKTWAITGAQMGARKNVDDIIDRIAPLARTGSFAERRAQAAEISAQGPDYTVELVIDEDRLREQLEAIAGEVNLEGHDAKVEFDPNKDSIEEMFRVTPETHGLSVDTDTMLQRISEDLQKGYTSQQELMTKAFTPKWTEEMLRESFHTLSEFRTRVSGTQDRKDNIKLALSRFNGMIIYPGEQVSFNATTGERSEANGYKMANVIGADKVYVPDWGGGVCQASTTLYNGVLMAGLQIDERSHHSIPSDYVDLGLDAMVNWPNRDFKFTNNTDRPIYIKTWTSSRNAYVTVYGLPLPDGQTIELKSEVLFKGELPEPEIRPDTKGQYTDKVTYEDQKYTVMRSHEEIKVNAHRIWKNADGEVIKDEVLYRDHFKALPGLVVTGTAPRPVVGPLPTSTPISDDDTE